MDNDVKNSIKEILKLCVNGAIKRTEHKIATDKSHKPFHKALLPTEIVKISSFERSFSTSLGQGPIEKISELVAANNGFEVCRQKEVHVNVYKGAVDEIERITSALRSGHQKPNWAKELKTITSFNKGDTVVRRVISDLWIRKNGIESYFSIKTVQPNLDQSEIAKKDMLLLNASDPKVKTFFALYYNPDGPKREAYKHSPPKKIFNMHNDPCVLIGKDYWDYLGGDGTYEELLGVFAEAGAETKESLVGFGTIK